MQGENVLVEGSSILEFQSCPDALGVCGSSSNTFNASKHGTCFLSHPDMIAHKL